MILVIEFFRSVIVTGIATAVLVAVIEYTWHRTDKPEPCPRRHRDEI